VETSIAGASGSATTGTSAPLDAGVPEASAMGGRGGLTSDAGAAPFSCDPEAASDDCEWCVQTRCCDARAACAEDPVCAEEWTILKACMAELDLPTNPTADPIAAVIDCMAEASATGNDIDVSDGLFELTTCIGTTAEESTDDLIAGDGLCTFTCYGVDTLQPVDFDEGDVDVR
jgi:hypothetical protein